MIADDLFAGAGGWDIAARDLGIEARGVENMPEARETRDANGLVTIHDDVWTFKPDGEASGLIASPPCQTFSQAGSGAGRQALDNVLRALHNGAIYDIDHLRELGAEVGDERTALVLTPLHFALTGDYEWLAFEQVPTVLPVWQAVAEVLEWRGWHTWTGFLNSEQYGVPQTRKRAFMLARVDGPVNVPAPTHSKYHSRNPTKLDPGVKKWVSMAEGLGWGECERVGFPRLADRAEVVTINGTDYRARDLRSATDPSQTVTEKARSWKRLHPEGACDCTTTFTATNLRPNVCQRTPCQPAPTLAFGHEVPRWNPRETTPDGKPRFAQQSDNEPDWSWPDNRPATVVAARDMVGAPGKTANRFNGSTKSRNDGVRVSVGEAGILQSFPANYDWRGSKTKQYLQCGNAVPPGMARPALEAAMGMADLLEQAA